MPLEVTQEWIESGFSCMNHTQKNASSERRDAETMYKMNKSSSLYQEVMRDIALADVFAALKSHRERVAAKKRDREKTGAQQQQVKATRQKI